MSYGTVQAEKMTTESGYSLGAGNASSFKNRLINGNCAIDQRNAGASITPTTSGTWFGVDRWAFALSQSSKFSVQQNAGSVTPPAGFKNYLGVTSLSAYSLTGNDYFALYQKIEANNISDLGWGSADAKSVSFSFWVYSSLTGSFGGSLQNDAENWMYSFAYTISSANTWTYITVTVPGPTSGTWLTGVNNGMYVWLGLGATGTRVGTAGSWGTQSGAGLQPSGTVSVVSTNGATFYVTGLQLEVGTVATSFDFRSIGTELQLCQRYFETSYPLGTALGTATGNGCRTASAAVAYVGATSTRAFMFNATFAVQKRNTPNTITFYDPNASNASGKISGYSSGTQYTVSSSSASGSTNLGSFITTTTGTQSEMYVFHFAADSEL